MRMNKEAIDKGAKLHFPTDVRGMVQRGNARHVTIGKHCVIGHDSWIVTHCPITSFTGNIKITIEDLVWTGLRCIILPGVHIGKASIIGAGSVLPKGYYEPYSIYAGNPARFIRRLTALEIMRYFNVRWIRERSLNGSFTAMWNLVSCEHLNYVFDLPREEPLFEDDPIKDALPWKYEVYNPRYFIDNYIL